MELLVEPLPASAEVPARELEVGRTPTGPESEGEPPARQLVDARRLLGEFGRAPGRREQHVRQEADSFGHRARGREDRQLLVAGIGHRADRGETRETGALGAPGPLEQLVPADAGNGVGDADADLHAVLLASSDLSTAVNQQ